MCAFEGRDADRKIQKQRARLKQIVEAAVDKHGITLDEEIHNDLKQIIKRENSELFNTFQKVFWQQVHAAFKDDARDMRWHPLMIKWCIYLRHQSQSAYETLRYSKCISPTIAESITMSNKYSATSSQAINLDNAVAYCIAKDMLPLQIVNKPGFRHMLSKLIPRYNLPSRRHFSDISIPRLFSQIRDSVVRPKLEQTVYFSATTDLWTSANIIPYLTFTVHFIDCHWSLCSFCLETLPLFKDHTGENIADAICDVLSNWNLDPRNLIATTTDNGSNFLSTFRTLDWCRISCFGHNLDLAISKSLQKNQIQRVIKSCHALVSLFHRSWKKNRDLLAKQTLMNLPKHKLT